MNYLKYSTQFTFMQYKMEEKILRNKNFEYQSLSVKLNKNEGSYLYKTTKISSDINIILTRLCVSSIIERNKNVFGS